MSTVEITTADIWKAIWLDNNRKSGAVADFLKTLLPAKRVVASTTGKKKVAFIVGHNSKSPGAFLAGRFNVSEWYFNKPVGLRMVELVASDPDLEVRVFYRKPFTSYKAQIKDVYKRVNEWDPDIALEGHFNWLGGAGRVEMLHYPDSVDGIKLAKCLLTETGKSIPGEQKLVPRGEHDRGGLSMASCKAPCVMTEPFDCSNEEHIMRVNELSVEGIAQINYRGIKKYFAQAA